MEQIELISQKVGSFSLVQLQNDANEWLKKNIDKDIVDISIISYPAQPDMPADIAGMGWLIMIRYTKT